MKKTTASSVFLIYTIVSILIVFTVGITLYAQFQDFSATSYRENLASIAAALEKNYPLLHEPEHLEKLGADNDDIYWDIQDKLAGLSDTFKLSRVYVLRRDNSRFRFVISSHYDYAMPDDRLFQIFSDPPAELEKAYLTRSTVITTAPVDVGWGKDLAVFHPIIYNGEVLSVIGAGYNGDYVSALRFRMIIAFIISIGAGIALALLFALKAISLARNLEETVRRHERELVEQTRLAEEASESKSQFLASMSHEIRTPMNVIQGMTELMRTDNLDSLQKNYLSDIRKMSRSLLQIINDILDFSKIEAGKLEINEVHYNFAELFDSVCSISKFSADAKSLLFKSSMDDAVPRVLYGDELRVRQVIINLVTNAIKYTEHGYVYLCVNIVRREGESRLAISVEDSGIGIKQDNIPKLFGKFQQLDVNRRWGIVGAGLGLSICKQLVSMMGGDIVVESEFGRGSTFTAYFPIVEGDPDKIERKSMAPRILANDSVEVLVVDDNTINLTVALGFLETHHIKADTATSGKQAIKMMEEKHYDLVFMDHMMPEMDGTEVTRRIRGMRNGWCKTIPIIALSANALAGVRDLFISSGMNDFIAKPIDADELNLVLSRWLPATKIADMVYDYDVEPPPPKEKTASPVSQQDDEERLLEILAEKPDLNVKAGLAHVGKKKDIYLGILRQFCDEYDSYIREITRFTAEENWRDYSIRLHALKSVFMNIGNENLSAWARKLELASSEHDHETCKKETEPFCYAMYLFKEKLLQTPLLKVTAGDERYP